MGTLKLIDHDGVPPRLSGLFPIVTDVVPFKQTPLNVVVVAYVDQHE